MSKQSTGLDVARKWHRWFSDERANGGVVESTERFDWTEVVYGGRVRFHENTTDLKDGRTVVVEACSKHDVVSFRVYDDFYGQDEPTCAFRWSESGGFVKEFGY